MVKCENCKNEFDEEDVFDADLNARNDKGEVVFTNEYKLCVSCLLDVTSNASDIKIEFERGEQNVD